MVSRENRERASGEHGPNIEESEGPGEPTGKTLLVVGLGRIGEAPAARARPFGVRVVAVKHEPARRYGAGVSVDEVLGPGARRLARVRPGGKRVLN